MKRGYFVTGTDTAVGKTLISAALLRAFAQRGERVIGMKPIAAGAEGAGENLYYADVRALCRVSNVTAPIDWINPYRFEPAVAPHIAAAKAGATISIETICDAFKRLQALSDVVIVEGVGGFKVPLGQELDTSDLARALALPIILVVGMRLGCLNHALLSQESIRAQGLTVAGWVANTIDPHMSMYEENLDTLRRKLAAPLIAVVPHLSYGDAEQGRLTLDVSPLV
jgi:dethiobiotin synthetase